MQDESASVQVYVLNPCLVHLPRQMDQYLILTAACDHMLVSEDGTLTESGSLQPFIAKSFQVQVPAGLNLQHRSVQDFAAKGCTTLKLRPREAGVAQLKVRLLTSRTLSLLLLTQIVLNVWDLNAQSVGISTSFLGPFLGGSLYPEKPTQECRALPFVSEASLVSVAGSNYDVGSCTVRAAMVTQTARRGQAACASAIVPG